MAKRLFALLSLVGLVVLAGCIGGIGQVTDVFVPGAATGLVIKEFGPDLPEVFSGDSVTFSLLVENIGEIDATSVTAKLMGLGTDWSGIPTTANAIASGGSIPKAQPSMGVPGGQDSTTWTVTSPSDLKVDKDYTAKVRLSYSYGTSAVGSIKVYDSDYLATLTQDEARAISRSSGLESWTVTNSPVTIELAGATRPFIVQDSDLSATVSFLVSNRGQGYPYTGTDQAVRGITITSAKVGTTTCISSKTDTLPRTGKKGFTCSFTISPGDVADFTTIPITVELVYNYYIDSSATVKVLQTLS